MTNITETTTTRIHVRLDVHKDTVVAAVARRPLESDNLEVEDRGDFKNRPASLKRWLAALTLLGYLTLIWLPSRIRSAISPRWSMIC